MNTKDWIPIILRQQGKCQDNWYWGRFHWFHMQFYIYKSIVCILLHRWHSRKYSEDWVDIAVANYRKTSSFEFGAGAEWTQLSVGYGWLSNWWVDESNDGYP
jgi:hypothetical protein